MYYITTPRIPRYHQMSLEELLFGTEEVNKTEDSFFNSPNPTVTYEVGTISNKFKKRIDTDNLINILKDFNEKNENLRKVPRRELYREFYIPKKSGGLRKIDAPQEELMAALKWLKVIFEKDFGALYHTSAFAYIKGRSAPICIQKHQHNNSKWFAKYDLSNFFRSTTPEFVVHMFEMVFPFSEILKIPTGRQEFMKAIDLAFLDGGLPMGTPISPTITNVMMIPVDFKLTKTLRDFNNQSFIYTRYSDDFQISSKYSFNYREVEKLISDTLSGFSAPFMINGKKTRYGSTSGRNWNLGLMLNKDNQLTVGYKKKKIFKAMLTNYSLDKKKGVNWDRHDIQHMEGLKNYYRMVEPEVIDEIVSHLSEKYQIDILSSINADLKAL